MTKGRTGTIKNKIAWLFIFLVILIIPGGQAASQSSEGLRPVDLMIVIDNSCSMFPKELILPGCTSFGSDPDFLRIKGADIFIARLGFGEENENQYQIGVVSLGFEPEVVSPLQPIQGQRDELAGEISEPRPQAATQIVPALETAYNELRENRGGDNLPAVVLITDGIPFPLEGQGNTVIENLVAENQDIPLFLMLLQGSEERSESYEDYIQFWQQMQVKYSHVFVYFIEEAGQIEETYNQIIAQLQDTIPTKSNMVAPEAPLQVYVSQYVQKMVITIVHPAGEEKGVVTVVDPFGTQVTDGDPGVSHFLGEENPIEVYSITAPRLAESMKEQYWTVRAEKPVDVFFDREGSYNINFLQPPASPTDINNVYVASERQNSNVPFTFRFNLLTEDGEAIIEPQVILGEVIFPDGTSRPLLVPSSISPDIQGVYEIELDLANDYPEIYTNSGRSIIVLNAGAADARVIGQIPIASARILIDFEPMPYIEAYEPQRILCSQDAQNQFTLSLGGFDTVIQNTLTARLFSENQEITLEPNAAGVYQGDLESLCQPQVSSLQCSTRRETVFQLKIAAQLKSGIPLQAIEREIPAEAIAPACTPIPETPVPTWTPRPTPTPVPIGDSDGDGLLDNQDACPSQRGWGMLNGCPPPGWLGRLAGIFGIGILFVAIVYGGPWVMVRTIAKPPTAYVMACQRGRTILEVTPIQEVGMERRTNRIRIGSHPRRAHIVIEGLRPVEFIVLEEDDKVVLKDAKSKALRETFGTIAPREVSTSNPQITLWIGANLPNMKKVRCQ